MRALIAAALAAVFATPTYAQDAKINEAATILSSIEKDTTKRKAYCELQALLARAEDAAAKKDQAQAKTLSTQAENKSQELGKDFEKVTAIEVDIDPQSDEGRQYLAAWESLEKSCSKS